MEFLKTNFIAIIITSVFEVAVVVFGTSDSAARVEDISVEKQVVLSRIQLLRLRSMRTTDGILLSDLKTKKQFEGETDHRVILHGLFSVNFFKMGVIVVVATVVLEDGLGSLS